MADVLSPEVQVRAMMLESGPPPAPIQPIVDSLRKSLDEDSAKAALRLAANTDVNQAKINFAINENIGIERNPDGTKNITTGSSEETRKTQATTIGDILGNIAEKGYDQLTLAQKDTAQTAVLDLLKSYPAFQNVMSGPPPRAAMTNAEKKAYVDRILSDPSHREQTIKKLSELTDVTNVNTDSVMQLQKEFSDIDDEISIMDGELTDVVTRITQIEDRLKEFQPEIVIDPTTTPPTTREGGTFRTITELAGQVGTHRIDQKNKTTDLAIKISKIAGYQRQLRVGGLNITQVTTITDAITVAEGLIAGLKTDIEDLNRQIDEKIAKKDALSRQEADFKTQLKAEEATKTDLETNRIKKATSLTEKELQLSKAKINQTFKEEKFVKDLQSVLSEATVAHINKQIEIATIQGKIILDKQAAEAKDNREKVVLNDLREKYFNGSKVDRDQIREDFNELMANGPDDIIRDGLVAGGMTAAEVTEALNDTEFMDKMRKDVGKKVMGFHLLRGGFLGRNGRITTDESLMIKNSTWGEQIINEAIKGNKDWQDELKKQMGAGIISGSGRLSESLKNMSTGRLISLLLLIFGGGLAAITFGPAAIGAAGGAIGAVLPK